MMGRRNLANSGTVDLAGTTNLEYSPGPIGSSTSFCSPGNYLPMILRSSPFATRGLGNSFDEVRCSLAWVTSHYLGSSKFALHWRDAQIAFRSSLELLGRSWAPW